MPYNSGAPPNVADGAREPQGIALASIIVYFVQEFMKGDFVNVDLGGGLVLRVLIASHLTFVEFPRYSLALPNLGISTLSHSLLSSLRI